MCVCSCELCVCTNKSKFAITVTPTQGRRKQCLSDQAMANCLQGILNTIGGPHVCPVLNVLNKSINTYTPCI